MQILKGEAARADKHPDYPAKPHTLIIDSRSNSKYLLQLIPITNPNGATEAEAWESAYELLVHIKQLLETSKTHT